MFSDLKFSDFAFASLPLLGMAWGWPFPTSNCGCCGGVSCRCQNIIWSDTFTDTSATGTGPETVDPSYNYHDCSGNAPTNIFEKYNNRLYYYNTNPNFSPPVFGTLYQTITTPNPVGLCVSVEAHTLIASATGAGIFIGSITAFAIVGNVFQYIPYPNFNTQLTGCYSGGTSNVPNFIPSAQGDKLTIRITEVAPPSGVGTGSIGIDYQYQITYCINDIVAITELHRIALPSTLNCGVDIDGGYTRGPSIFGNPSWDNFIIATN